MITYCTLRCLCELITDVHVQERERETEVTGNEGETGVRGELEMCL